MGREGTDIINSQVGTIIMCNGNGRGNINCCYFKRNISKGRMKGRQFLN